MVWIKQVSERKNPSLSASRMATRAHSGISRPFAQQIDANQYVESAQTQIADNLDALQGFDIAVHVAHAHALFMHIFGKIFCHLLGQGGDQGAIALSRHFAAFGDQIVDLGVHGPDLDWGIDKSGGADHLFGEDAAGALHLPGAGRGPHKDRLRAHRVPFLELQRTVIDAAGQTKAIFGQGEFAAIIAFIHGTDLRHRDMAFVGKDQRIVGQIFKQSGRRLARLTAGQPARIILDAGAGTGSLDHLQVEGGALFQALGFQQFALGTVIRKPLRSAPALMPFIACCRVGRGVT